MKKLMRKQSGFTLIEIIVVLIILGVLAAIALPSLFSNVTRSRGAEGLASLSAYRSVVEGCVQGHPGSEATCNGITFIASPNFTYPLTGPAAGGNWTITATGSGTLAGNSITLTRTGGATTSPTITCVGSGTSLSGIC